MNRTLGWGIVFAAWIAILVGVYYWWLHPRDATPPTMAPPVAEAPPPPPAVEPEPQTRYPIEEARPDAQAPKAAAPLPPLNESDNVVEQSLADLIGRGSVAELLNVNGFIRRFVATVDNLPRAKVAQRLWPAHPPKGRFATKSAGDGVYLSADNYRRYAPFVQLMERVDTGKLVALYVELYPLFQQAYADLGYPKANFNDRLVEVIDHLLATPDVKEPIKLARPWIFYEFADSELEARSAGQKSLIRMGSANAAKVKAKLRDVRRQVTGRTKEQKES
jgi:hypothetical protein